MTLTTDIPARPGAACSRALDADDVNEGEYPNLSQGIDNRSVLGGGDTSSSFNRTIRAFWID